MKSYRMVHVLFSRLPQVDYLKRLIADYAELGANSLLLEYVDRFPYRKHPGIVHPESFTLEEWSECVALAESSGLEIVPLIQSFGHVDTVLKHEAYRGLAEVPISPKQCDAVIPDRWQYCPQREETFEFLMDCYEELFAQHPHSTYLHIGCDETWELAACPDCKDRGPAEIFADWVNRLNREVRRRWGKSTMIWGDMLIPFTCESPTYPRIADLLDKDMVICYWNYWGTRVFPHLEYYREKGFRVIASSSSYASGQYFTSVNQHIPNVAGFARKSGMYDHVIGDLITSWGGPPMGAEVFIQGVGLEVMRDPHKDFERAERDVAKKLCGSDDPALVDAIHLLGGVPHADDAPWRKLACGQAKQILARHDLSNPYLAVLDLQADFFIWEATRLEQTVKPSRRSRPWSAAELDGEPLSVNEERLRMLKKAFPEVLNRLFCPESARELVGTYVGHG
ncbi:MAG: family 20 glycosylhydrolase [Candidatus Latescibacterota bacterium]